jgi:hypothetical protein
MEYEWSLVMQKTMNDFIQLTKSDSKRAKALFFSESFKTQYLEEEQELKDIYHELLLGRNKEQIFDEFLIYVKAREPVSLQMKANVLEDKVIVTVTKEVQGYAQGRILLEGDGVSLEENYLYNQNFQDSMVTIPVQITKKSVHKRKCRIRIQLPRREFFLDFVVPEREKTQTELLEEDLLKLYVKFCKGLISKDFFVAEGTHRLKIARVEEAGQVYISLLQLHFDILHGDERQIEEGFLTIESDYETEINKGLCQCYYFYLKALYARSEGRIQKAVATIEHYYENEGKSSYPLWMLCYLDERLMKNPERELKQIKNLEKNKVVNGLLCFEVCNLFGQDVQLCRELGNFEYQVLRFGVDHQCILPKLWIHVNHLVKKTKDFQERWLSLMIDGYKQTEIPELLQGVCSLLIRGNYMSPSYHFYYAKGIEAGVKVIGLLEAYIATIPRGEYPILNQDVLLYFSYSNSLNHTRLANLYANIVKNRWKYDGIYEQYHSKIKSFLIQQLSMGKVSEDLIFLYHGFFEELCKNPLGHSYLGNILYYQKISHIPRGIHHVLLIQKELREDEKRTVEHGIAYVNVLSEHPFLVFVDQDENRYVQVPHKVKGIWSQKEMAAFEKSGSFEDENRLIRDSIVLYHKEKFEESDIDMVQRVLVCQSLDEKYQHVILEKLINYYFERKEYDKIRDNLPLIHLEFLSRENCSSILELLIGEKQYEEALKGIRLFGCIGVEAESLKELTLWLLKANSSQLDDNLLTLGEEVFKRGIYNHEIIEYLQKYYMGDLEFMIEIWEKGKELGSIHQDFMERILRKGWKEKNLESLLTVLLSYSQLESPEWELIYDILNDYVTYGYRNQICFDSPFYELLGKQIEQGGFALLNQWVFLDYYKDKELSEGQKKQVELCIEYETAHGCLLPVLFEYRKDVALPMESYSTTYIVYQEAEDKNFTFHMVLNSGSQIDVRMKEMVPGYYVCTHDQFADDVTDYFITLPRQQNRRRKDIQWISPENQKDKGRFYLLNQMLQDQRNANMPEKMRNYAYQKSMIEWLEETDDNNDTF